MTITLRVDGEPKAQPRPKMARRGSFVTTYYPKGEWQSWKEKVTYAVRTARKGYTHDGPVRIFALFGMPIPKYLSKTVVHGQAHCFKPDTDNLAKLMLDAMTDAALFKDDSQVFRLELVKSYSDKPGLEATIEFVG